MGRFLNADAFASTGQGFLGFNMFAYCLGNPVSLVDLDGCTAGVAVMELTGSAWLAFEAWLTGIAATNWWNAVGWAATAILTVGVIAGAGWCLYQAYLAENETVVETPIEAPVLEAAAAPPPNNRNNDDDDDYDDYYDNESNFGHREPVGKHRGNTTRNNQVQNAQVRQLARKYGLGIDQVRRIHNEITGRGLGFAELEQYIIEWLGVTWRR